MTQLERHIRTAQSILWFNRWQLALAWALTISGLVFAVWVLVQRLFDWPLPMLWVGAGLAGGAVVLSVVWTLMKRIQASTAAAALDQAAGLRERVSSGVYCLADADPFAQAVVSDAERAVASLTVSRHIRVKVPREFAFTAGSFVLAALMFLVSPGLLKSEEAMEAEGQSAEREQAQVAVKREMDQVRKLTEENPVLAELTPELANLDTPPTAKLQRPEAIRHEAVKKIDKLEDAVQRKRSDEKYDAVPEMKKMLRGLRIPESENAPTEKLSKALAKGDFKEAQEEAKKLKEQLATLKAEEDKELVQKMSRQLEDLAKQLEKLAEDDKLAQKLEQAGIKKEDVDRMLERLSKADLEQVKKQLEEKGLSQKQIESLAKQLQQKQQTGAMAKQLAQGMQKASQGAQSGQEGQAAAGLQQAADQLGELEQLEQEMNQLDSAMADLKNSRGNLDKPCSRCKGTGQQGGQPCSGCNKPGGGMGGMGQGRGGLAPEEQTAVDFKIERQKVHTGKGASIGEFLVDGEQVKGEVSTSMGEVVTAAEREASDLIHRDRVPRQYHKAIKEYFSNLKKSSKEPTGNEKEDAESSPTEEPEPKEAAPSDGQ